MIRLLSMDAGRLGSKKGPIGDTWIFLGRGNREDLLGGLGASGMKLEVGGGGQSREKCLERWTLQSLMQKKHPLLYKEGPSEDVWQWWINSLNCHIPCCHRRAVIQWLMQTDSEIHDQTLGWPRDLKEFCWGWEGWIRENRGSGTLQKNPQKPLAWFMGTQRV